MFIMMKIGNLMGFNIFLGGISWGLMRCYGDTMGM